MRIKNKTPLSEITRWEIIRRSQREASGHTDRNGQFVDGRWQKKQLYRAKDTNNVDFSKLFETDTFVWSSRVGDYIVTISFEGAFSNLYDMVRGWGGKNRYKRITLKMLTQCLSKALDTEDLYVNCTCPDFCLHEDTLIKLLDGNDYSIKDIHDKFNDGEDIWVYATDKNGDFKPGHVSDVWISGYSNRMIKVVLDNDKEIITTPNHLYMLRTGEYLRADELSVGQSLMPLYFQNKGGYECVMLNSKPKSFVSVYKEVANCVLEDQINEAKIRSGEDIISIHHRNFNKLDNTPSNLYPMGHQEHYKYHYTHVMENKEAFSKFVEKGHEYWRTPEGRKIKSEQMKMTARKFWDSMTEEERNEYNAKSHAWAKTDSGRKKFSSAMKKYWDNLDPEVKRERVIQSAIAMNGENGELASARARNYWASLTDDEYAKRCAQNRENLKKAKITDKCIEARRKNGKIRQRNHILEQGTEILNEILNNNLTICEETYNRYRKKGYPHYNTIVEYGLLETFNHRVKSIEIIEYDDPIPVYDMTVDEYNNFYVSAGVMLHNCYRFAYWLTQADAKYGTPENRPPKVRNVKNNKGYVCKHLLAVLYGKRWVPAAAKSWYNFIQANPELSEEMIWG